MKTVYNFSAGPSVLPKAALETAQHEFLNFQGTGMSVMELSHRAQPYETVHNETIDLFRELMKIPSDYEVLFIQGGASLQFTMLPMNFGIGKKVGYIDGGTWGKKAIAEAKKFSDITVETVATSKDSNYRSLPIVTNIPADLAYLHITTNNTIEGTTHFTIPETTVPVIADMSSNIMSVDYCVTDFDMIYAGAQKNLGPAGVTVVIIKKSFMNTGALNLPSMLDYRVYAESDSLYNTPPTLSIYMMREVLRWVKNNGGVTEMERRAHEKASLLYKALDDSSLFTTPVVGEARSLNNIPFFTESDELNKEFLKEAEARNLVNLKGHRLVGGMRASIYNAMPHEGVEALVALIKDFDKKYGG